MKRNIIAAITLAVALVSCQKNVDAPIAANDLSAASVSDAQIINPTPVATFSSAIASHVVSTVADIIFSDSFYVTQNQAYLQVLKFGIQGKNLRFGNYSIYLNGVRSYVTGTFENGVMTIVLNRKKPLPVGAYYLEVKAKVAGPAQVFNMYLKQGDAVITDKFGFIANIIGLPLQSTVEIQK
jgi:hypothetical protein